MHLKYIFGRCRLASAGSSGILACIMSSTFTNRGLWQPV